MMNASQIGNVYYHHITAWRYSVITVLTANFKNVREGEKSEK